MEKKKIIILVVIIVIILLLLWGYKKMNSKTPAELEKEAAELRAKQAGAKYSQFMQSRVY